MFGATTPSVIVGQTGFGAEVESMGARAVELVVVEVEVVDVVAVQIGPLIVLASKVTVAAAWAKTRPLRVAPVCRAVVSATSAVTILPINDVFVPRVAALPILHQT